MSEMTGAEIVIESLKRQGVDTVFGIPGGCNLPIFDKLYDLKATGGPMFEQYMRNALLLLMEDMPNEPATLIEVPRVFTDAAWRTKKLERIHNPVVLDFWQKEAVKGEEGTTRVGAWNLLGAPV